MDFVIYAYLTSWAKEGGLIESGLNSTFTWYEGPNSEGGLKERGV